MRLLRTRTAAAGGDASGSTRQPPARAKKLGRTIRSHRITSRRIGAELYPSSYFAIPALLHALNRALCRHDVSG